MELYVHQQLLKGVDLNIMRPSLEYPVPAASPTQDSQFVFHRSVERSTKVCPESLGLRAEPLRLNHIQQCVKRKRLTTDRTDHGVFRLFLLAIWFFGVGFAFAG